MSDNTEALLASVTIRALANDLTLLLGAAVELGHADVLRKAFSKLYDFSAVEEQSKRMMLVITRCEERIREAQIRIAELEERLTKAAQYAAKLSVPVNGQPQRVTK